MNKLVKPASILLYLLSFVVFVLLGATYAAVVGAADGQGLAGGAIVLGYGLIAGLLALIAAVVLVYRSNLKTVVTGNLILFVLLVVFITALFVRKKMQQQPVNEAIPALLNTEYVHPMVYVPGPSAAEQKAPNSIGLGFFSPKFYHDPVLFFYGNPNLQKTPEEHIPFDSLVFARNEFGNYTISYAPPWLLPEHLKLDYELLYFNIKSLGKTFVEITVNRSQQTTAFVDRFEGSILFWPEFLLAVNSVEMLPDKQQPIRIKPLDYAGTVRSNYTYLHPISVSNEWLQVELQDTNFKSMATGWLRWKQHEQLLISYSLLH